jgi:hypothetical membrane protein
MRDTISALAARSATDPWIMTTGLTVLGLCHIATAAGLTEATATARALLALGGAATVAVAAAPQPAGGHVPAATVGFVALALWPATSGLPGRGSARVATALLLALLCWLGFALHYAHLLGLSERAVAGAEALWPLAVVVVLVTRSRPAVV